MRPGPAWGLGVAAGAAVILLSSCGSSSSTRTVAGSTTSTAAPGTSTSVPTPTSPTNCRAGQLQASRLATAAAAGHIVNTYGVRNVSASTCTLLGYPGVQMVDASGKPLPTQVSHGGTYTFASETPTTVVLPAGAQGSFFLGYSDVSSGNASCPQATRLLVTPPNDNGTITIADQIAPCGGAVAVSPVRPGTAPPP